MKEEVMFGKLILNVVGPATPEENGENHSTNKQQDCPGGSSETPKETLFDSFAPPASSDEFLLAPQHYKYRQEWRNHVVRRLDFTGDDSNSNSNVSNVVVEIVDKKNLCYEKQGQEEEEEQRLFEIVYTSIMDAILSDLQDAKEEAPTTPKSAPLLDGIASTCPAPPIKPFSTQHRFIIDKEICKKLDF